MERYVDFYNNKRPCFAIGYDTPVNYRKRFYKGEIACKKTFDSRTLTTEPKFVQKRRKQALPENESTFLDYCSWGNTRQKKCGVYNNIRQKKCKTNIDIRQKKCII